MLCFGLLEGCEKGFCRFTDQVLERFNKLCSMQGAANPFFVKITFSDRINLGIHLRA